ncbi:MAG: ribonuclease J, partial [Rickettsiales bacterium]|nr:ribonuclease J [Rickettsiales bacterium]
MEIKNFNFKKYSDELLFIPLGGSSEIGLNCNLYHYGEKWLMVDCGLGFTKDNLGVNFMVPDASIFRKIKKDLLGLFITHIHEDHIGAVPHLWPELRTTIYASKFTKLFLREKMREYDFVRDMKVVEISDGQKIKLPPFEVEVLNLTHSTPDMDALIISTPKGKILHTGDWKFDNKPMVGVRSNIKKLKQLGAQRELLATVCDSTNVFSLRKNNSEGDLYDNLYDLVKRRSGIIVFTTFASNIGRLKTILEVARKTKRKVAVVGLSLIKLVKVAKEAGYIEKGEEILGEDDLKNYKKGELIVIATGCQGESNAAMDKIANNGFRNIRLDSDDTVIFSSSIIPGNEKDLLYLYNKLADKNVEVLTDKNYFVHVSGHYTVEDLKNFYAYTRPKIAVAVHGESIHLLEHQKIAKSCGIKNAVKSSNGMILRLDEKKPEKIGH